jgi:hypothetical protein
VRLMAANKVDGLIRRPHPSKNCPCWAIQAPACTARGLPSSWPNQAGGSPASPGARMRVTPAARCSRRSSRRTASSSGWPGASAPGGCACRPGQAVASPPPPTPHAPPALSSTGPRRRTGQPDRPRARHSPAPVAPPPQPPIAFTMAVRCSQRRRQSRSQSEDGAGQS